MPARCRTRLRWWALGALLLLQTPVNGQCSSADIDLTLNNAWGPCDLPETWCFGDLNGDGVAEAHDLMVVVSGWTP